MGSDFVASDLVEVKASGARFGHRGWIGDRFASNRQLYAIQFPDNCVGYFEEWELEKVSSVEAATDWGAVEGVHDIAELETHP